MLWMTGATPTAIEFLSPVMPNLRAVLASFKFAAASACSLVIVPKDRASSLSAFISDDDLFEEMKLWNEAVNKKVGHSKLNNLVSEGKLTQEEVSVWMDFKAMGEDPGRFCALKGYDGISVHEYYVIVNRSKLIVQ